MTSENQNERKEFLVSNKVNTEQEFEQLLAFLKANQLPTEDITLSDNHFVRYYNTREELVACGGLEFYGEHALLRSLAVSQDLRGQFIGKRIVTDLLKEARANTIKEIYLLTQTAYYFFLKFGFTEVARNEVPAGIQSSAEFSRLCPASARVMKLVL